MTEGVYLALENDGVVASVVRNNEYNIHAISSRHSRTGVTLFPSVIPEPRDEVCGISNRKERFPITLVPRFREWRLYGQWPMAKTLASF